jgi:hypothetical protein
MAFATLEELRALLNTDLGLTDDTATEPWGSETARNRCLQHAFRKLWPTMARLRTEAVTIVDNQLEYELTSIRDIARIEVLDSDGLQKSAVKSWQLLVDESDADDEVVRRLLIPELSSEVTLRVIGYSPYIVPPGDNDECDLPNEQEHVVVTGARAEAYRRRMTSYFDYEQHGVENMTTRGSPEQLLQMYLVAKDEFGALIREHARDIAAPRRASLALR